MFIDKEVIVIDEMYGATDRVNKLLASGDYRIISQKTYKDSYDYTREEYKIVRFEFIVTSFLREFFKRLI